MPINYASIMTVFLLAAAGLPAAAAASTVDNDNSSSLPGSNITAGEIIDLVEKEMASNQTVVVEEEGGGEGEDNDSPFANASVPSPASEVVINEVELNPRGIDAGKEWIELYNPTGEDIDIGDFKLNASFKGVTIDVPQDAVIEAEGTYVIEFDRQTLSNTAEVVVISNGTGEVMDRTPSLIDRSDDGRTWQRMPDGNNEWQFAANTKGRLNDPDAVSALSSTVRQSNQVSDADCTGSAGCAEGVVVRIVDGDTLYVRVGETVYKVDLALAKTPSRDDGDGFRESTALTRNLCLGSDVLVDQDDDQLTSDGSVVAMVYCASENLNRELLDSGYAALDEEQCAKSEFGSQAWAREHGC